MTDTSSSEEGVAWGEGVQCSVFSGNGAFAARSVTRRFPSPTLQLRRGKKPPREEMHANRNAAPKPKENHFSPLHPTYSPAISPRFTSLTATGRAVTLSADGYSREREIAMIPFFFLLPSASFPIVPSIQKNYSQLIRCHFCQIDLINRRIFEIRLI